MLETLQLWVDGVRRAGPENMAVDEWLLESARVPVLRVYGWEEGWGSCGYFVPAAEVDEALPGLPWVRRWTGGGIVDHRSDWTYTLVVPCGQALAGLRGGESYRIIHAALAAALTAEGVALAGHAGPARGGVCFARAVEHDLVDAAGRKLAGAGQRRTRAGLLHQGSLAEGGGGALAWDFARRLAECVELREVRPPAEHIAALAAARYRSAAWNRRR